LSRHFIFGLSVSFPCVMTLNEYARRYRQHAIRQNWTGIINNFKAARSDEDGLINFKFDIPGDETSAFATIFGKNEVNIEVNGQANLNLGASIQKNENPRI